MGAIQSNEEFKSRVESYEYDGYIWISYISTISTIYTIYTIYRISIS